MNTPATGVVPARRPLKSRQRAWAQSLARLLTRTGIAPNTISVISVAFAAAAGLALWRTALTDGLIRSLLFLTCASCIQLRLLCNLMDGLVAVEGGRKTVYGEVFNDLPDRVADVIILVGAGYGIGAFSWGLELGWLAAALALMTAYIRVLGGSLGLQQSFIGPMAKQHRMALLTGGCLLSTVESYLGFRGQVIAATLMLMILGEVVTCIRRTARIAGELKAR